MSATAFPEGVAADLRPSPPQLLAWGPWIIPELGVDKNGSWSGWCPLHDADCHDTDAPSATFNFLVGVFRCEANESCHAPKKSMTLWNLAAGMAAAGVPLRGVSYFNANKELRDEQRAAKRKEWLAIREQERQDKIAAAKAKYAKPSSLKSQTDAE